MKHLSKNKRSALSVGFSFGGLVVVTALSGCALFGNTDYSERGHEVIKTSFRAEGIAGLDRIQQDSFQALCSNPVASQAKDTEALRVSMQNKALAAIAQPADGNYFGDWKQGEKIAQSGRGATWTDKADAENGGGCYNCHQIDKKEISHGTIGPSLWNYGKLRGKSEPVVQYTWNRLNNSKAYNACSNMPRFGHNKVLTEQQLKHLMALLLDPASPVNQ
ncbi:MAG: sulfur oxidation c-type cytochrome SoxX [Burkholderiales bacterium]|jgi:sulfur-oxidizing protein SoxX|nr:sulfur oxidation c-type cytochrome SoxX [Burkholderiales bacterium]